MRRFFMEPEADEREALSIKRFASVTIAPERVGTVFSAARWINDKRQETGDFSRLSRHFPFAGVVACIRHDPIQDRYLYLGDRPSSDGVFGVDHPVRIHELFFVKDTVEWKARRSPDVRIRIGDVHPLVLSECLWLASQAAGVHAFDR
jgi:hypothetical protein